jgi:hypothetical protein
MLGADSSRCHYLLWGQMAKKSVRVRSPLRPFGQRIRQTLRLRQSTLDVQNQES